MRVQLWVTPRNYGDIAFDFGAAFWVAEFNFKWKAAPSVGDTITLSLSDISNQVARVTDVIWEPDGGVSLKCETGGTAYNVEEVIECLELQGYVHEEKWFNTHHDGLNSSPRFDYDAVPTGFLVEQRS